MGNTISIKHMPVLRFLKISIAFGLLAAVVVAIAALFALEHIGVPPRSLGPYLERRASGHNPFIVKTGVWMNRILTALDRGDRPVVAPSRLRIGAQAVPPHAPTISAVGSAILVSSPEEVITAIARARPGDVITLMPGIYRFRGRSIDVRQAGSRENRITVRAERLDSVFLEFDMNEGFAVSGPYWTFENLNIRGVCRDHSYCEHAFHVAGNGTQFIARNNRIEDFNAHFKINGTADGFPDHGLIERNTLSNRSVRQTGNPVTVIDLVAASHWEIRGNFISDFAKAHSNQVSYGAFAKGAGSNNRFEQNAVICEYLLRHVPGQRVGLSFGGGGTGKPFCRDKRCITEQDGSILQSNLIAFCSDDGIYINRSATSKVLHNTLIDTGPISVRFAESSADVQGNLVDGAIRSRDGGVVRAEDNYETSTAQLYLGQHPVRNLYDKAEVLNLRWKDSALRRRPIAGAAPPDLCGTPRPAAPAYGAFENFSDCLRETRY
jgi:hypothetical protein